MFGSKKIEIKSPDQIALMRKAGLIVATALSEVRDALRPGLSALELNDLAHAVILDHGAQPSFLDYEGFPKSLCISINDEVIHGIPNQRIIAPGDVVSFDCGAFVDGWHADSALTVIVGEPEAPEHTNLVTATERAMWAGIAAVASAKRVNGIGKLIETEVDVQSDRYGWDFGIVEEFVGHRIGSTLHQDPDVPNFRVRGLSPKIIPGMCLAIEPMLTLGSPEIEILDDGWTVRTVDRAFAAHWEHTVAVLEDGICVLTAHDGGKNELEGLGIKVVTL